ncbi:MinD/ParA family ATP-binding protein [Nocardia blacklockiae]|uniref:MinD/ParA family ATP-binding protein n=1 Tax=Nocardia blacklockiae TaxID=480036 RepID=UPI0018951151|nr:hypothetical protein [Nocardia blacklockiae]MBF6171133.1 hypothetical protein [Nocardia blacklockiae]
MSTSDDENPTPPAEHREPGAAQYDAERPVDLRAQRLRPEPTEARPAMHLRPRSPQPGAPDRYGVSHDEPAGPSAAELEAIREERIRRLLGPAPGSETDPAQWGWRGRANTLGARLKPTRAEIEHRVDIERIRQPLPGTPLVTVANPKGGSGTTPATVLLSNIFGLHRGHGVVGWDNHETRGTLAARAATGPQQPSSTWDLLANAHELCAPTVAASALARFLIRQPSGDEILASDQSAKRTEMIGAEECRAILAVLRRHRTLIIADTGNNDRAPTFRHAIDHTTQLVVPITYRRDVAHAALRTLDGLAARGHARLVRTAIVVLTEDTAPDAATRTAVEEALERAEIGPIVRVPFDPALANGERIVLSRLPATTVRAWTRVAAAVAENVADELATATHALHTDYMPESRTVPLEYDARDRTAVTRRPPPRLWRDDTIPPAPGGWQRGGGAVAG